MSPVTAIQPIAKNDLFEGRGKENGQIQWFLILETSLGVQLVLFPLP